MKTALRALLAALAAAPLSACCLWRTSPPEYDAIALESGLVIEDLVVPETGPRAAPGDRVAVHYEMWLAGGEKIDASFDRGEPIRFVVGAGEVPAGLDQGVVGMRRFGRRLLQVPPALGYGGAGRPPLVPPGAALKIRLELIELEARREPDETGGQP
ncbi:MAG: FKBP-type peptidyl-prolyl cis-trans isomerase [Planctomycetota bacterium]